MVEISKLVAVVLPTHQATITIIIAVTVTLTISTGFFSGAAFSFVIVTPSTTETY
jgi:hypothetical protein